MKKGGAVSESAVHMGDKHHPHHGFSFLSDTLKLISGAGAAQIIRALLSPIISRLFLPQTLGVAQNFSAIAKTLAVLSTLRYEDSIQIPKKRSGAYHQLLVCILLTTLTSMGALLLIVFFRGHIASPQIRFHSYIVISRSGAGRLLNTLALLRPILRRDGSPKFFCSLRTDQQSVTI